MPPASGFETNLTSTAHPLASSGTGSVVTEGDSILGADLVRQLGFDGTGVKVGIISDGANDRATAQALGDLPQNITTYGSCAPRVGDGSQCLSPWTCNEGTAIMEIIHDLAPGAELAMGAVGTSLEFIQRVDDLVDDFGADIVIDDLGFLDEPYFADGPIAQAVASVTDQVVYVSSAGNSATPSSASRSSTPMRTAAIRTGTTRVP